MNARPRRLRVVVVVACLFVEMVVGGCGGGGAGGAADATPLPDLLAAAQALRDSDDPFFGRAPLAALDAELAQEVMRTPLEQLDLDLRVYAHRLRFGDVDAAITAIERARQAATKLPELRPRLAQFEFWRGLAWLRRAEQRNCIERHEATCCIWPFEGAGIHGDAAPARHALDAFLAAHRLRPDDLGLQWLAHVAAAAAAVPHLVPESIRVPRKTATRVDGVPRFEDRAPMLGVATFDVSGGAIVADLDGDGWLDLASSSSEPFAPMKYFRNRGDGTFEDRSVASGLARQIGGLNCLAADYDGDGDVDVLVLRGAWLMDRGRIRNSLLRNDGKGVFTDVTHAAGLAFPACPTQAAAFGDFDGDGHLDLYIGNESRREIGPHPGEFPSQLFRNNGDGTFTDVAVAAGVTNDRYAKGVAVGDYDDDGDLDIYVSNVGRNRLYRNDGGMKFTDVAEALGVTGPTGRSFACWFFDYDNDGRLDLFVAGYEATLGEVAGDLMRAAGRRVVSGGETPRLYRNVGGGRFEDVTKRVGLDRVCLPMGANFGDVDGDGFLDVYLATGDPNYETLTPNLLLRNDGGERFVDVTEAAGLGHLQKGHGVAFGDLDHDGDQDLWHQLGGFYPGDAFYNALFVHPGPARSWVKLELQGTRSNRAAYGARVDVEFTTPNGARRIHRAVGSVSSFGSSSPRVELGLADATAITRITVRWPSGTVQHWTDVARNTTHRFVE